MIAITRRAVYRYWENTGKLPESDQNSSVAALVDSGVDFMPEIRGMLLTHANFAPLDPFYERGNKVCISFDSDERADKVIQLCGSPLRYMKLSDNLYVLVSAGENGLYDLKTDEATKKKLLKYDHLQSSGNRTTSNAIDNDLVYFGMVGL